MQRPTNHRSRGQPHVPARRAPSNSILCRVVGRRCKSGRRRVFDQLVRELTGLGSRGQREDWSAGSRRSPAAGVSPPSAASWPVRGLLSWHRPTSASSVCSSEALSKAAPAAVLSKITSSPWPAAAARCREGYAGTRRCSATSRCGVSRATGNRRAATSPTAGRLPWPAAGSRPRATRWPSSRASAGGWNHVGCRGSQTTSPASRRGGGRRTAGDPQVEVSEGGTGSAAGPVCRPTRRSPRRSVAAARAPPQRLVVRDHPGQLDREAEPVRRR